MSDAWRTEMPKPIEWTPELVDRFWNGVTCMGIGDRMAFGRMARRCIHWIIARHLVIGGRHLDYGGGSGDVAAHLIAQGFPFAVYDPARKRQSKTEATLAGVDGFLGGAGDVPSATFDAVTCFEVLEHVLDQHIEQVCDELTAHLKPGGTLIISTPNSEDLALEMVYCPISNHYFHRWQHVRTITPKWLINMFERRGIEKVSLQQLDFAESLFEPYLHMMGHATPPPNTKDEVVPHHIHNIMHDVDGTCGGATRLLYVGRKSGEPVSATLTDA